VYDATVELVARFPEEISVDEHNSEITQLLSKLFITIKTVDYISFRGRKEK